MQKDTRKFELEETGMTAPSQSIRCLVFPRTIVLMEKFIFRPGGEKRGRRDSGTVKTSNTPLMVEDAPLMVYYGTMRSNHISCFDYTFNRLIGSENPQTQPVGI